MFTLLLAASMGLGRSACSVDAVAPGSGVDGGLEKDGQVTTFAGNGPAAWIDGDDLLAASFSGLEGLTRNPDGTRLIVADGNQGDGTNFNRVRLVTLAP